MESDQRILLRVKAAAQKLDISVSQAYNLINRGELLSVKVGRSIRIPARELVRILEGGSRTA